MTKWNFLSLRNHSIFKQLQLEEALLRTDDQNWCILNRGTSPAIVLGVSAEVSEVVNLTKPSLPIIRRFSGGGNVIVDEDTYFITFICQTSSLPIQPFPQQILKWTEELYKPLFKELPFQMAENDYIIGNKKFGGNAQSICKGRWLHHSSLLWDFSNEKMDYLLHPKKTPQYRQNRSHSEFLCKLSSYWPSKESWEKELIEHLQSSLQLELAAIPVISKPHRQATKREELTR